MKKALVSGVSGFIGGKLVKELLSNGVHVTSIGRTDPGIDGVPHIDFDFTELDKDLSGFISESLTPELTEMKADAIVKSLPEDAFDVFYHTSWSGVNGSDKKNIDIQYLNLHTPMLTVRMADKYSSRLVTLGSASEFSKSSEIIYEDSEASPLDVYGAFKYLNRIFEKKLSESYDVDIRQTVVGSIYGPGRSSGDALSFCINKLLDGENPSLDSNGEQLWDFLHVDDLVRTLILIGEDNFDVKNYVISYNDSRPLKDFLEEARIAVGRTDLNVYYGNQEGGFLKMRPNLPFVSESSVVFTDGVGELVAYMRKNKSN